KPDEVLKGKKQIRGGLTITLEQAFGSPTIAKLDVIGFVQQNRFTDFSVIYEFHNKGHPLNPDKIDIVKSLKENIIAYESEGNIFKSLKRRFALAKYEGDHKIILELTPILNSDLGRLYIIIGDIGTLIALLEDFKAPQTKIKYEINQFKNRLANIYTLRDYLKNENKILSEIDSIVKRPTGTMIEPLSKLRDELEKYLQDNTKKIIKDMKVLKGSGDFDAELQEALSRNPKIREDVNKGTAVVRTKFFDDGIRGIVSEDKWRQGYERRKQSPPEPYKSFRDKVIDRLLQRSLEFPAETERLKKAQETLAETNKKYADFYAANPEYEPVLCNLNEKLEPVKDRGVPKAVCEERHKQKIKNMERERAARDPFNPVMKGIFSVGDVLSNVLPTIAPGVGTVLKTAWDTTRGIADPEGEYTDEGVKKLTSMGIDALMANENKGKGKATGFVRRLIAEQMKEPTKPILNLSKMKTKPSASLKKIAEKVKPRETHAERQRKKETEKFYKEREEQQIKMLKEIKYA
ncbi:hypothetical protein EBU94_06950, partial [bacterium]|nr:hypothetical protein [bacterium]